MPVTGCPAAPLTTDNVNYVSREMPYWWGFALVDTLYRCPSTLQPISPDHPKAGGDTDGWVLQSNLCFWSPP